jgi:hypothetical protein
MLPAETVDAMRAALQEGLRRKSLVSLGDTWGDAQRMLRIWKDMEEEDREERRFATAA